MYKNTNPLFLICETQLHAGSGDDLGVVDLPIQRERHTSFPKIEASSLKGAIREAFETYFLNGDEKNIANGVKKINQVFGFDESSLRGFSKEKLKELFKDEFGADQTQFSGAISFTDARLLFFPVKSMKGVFTWVTCEKVLKRFKSDLLLCESKNLFSDLISEIDKIKDDDLIGSNVNYCYASSEKVLVGEKNLILEEYAFETKPLNIKKLSSALQSIFNLDFSIADRLVVLSNDDFKDFANLSTEVITRTKISNETGTVEDGALFTEEFLPAESILYNLISTAPEFRKGGMEEPKVKEFISKTIDQLKVVQIGGNATLGKGLVRTKFMTTK